MAFGFENIVRRAVNEPRNFVDDCEDLYNSQLSAVARELAGANSKSRVVLLSGPSGSGKTTTAKKLAMQLEKIGIGTHTISLDNYFRTVELSSMPKNEDGLADYESPACLDIPLLAEHFTALDSGEEIIVPKFDFVNQARNLSRGVPLKLKNDEMAIFEGIHALNDLITGKIPNAQTVFVSADSNITDGHDTIRFFSNWTRLIRRMVRDGKYRGMEPSMTMSIWANVRRGELYYIKPFKSKAGIVINSSLPYEVCVMRRFCREFFDDIPDDIKNRDELLRIGEALDCFPDIDDTLPPSDSLLREFIGGSGLSYSF